MEDRVFLGTGVKFPPQVSPATGRFVSVSGEDSVRESIYLILMTQKGERFMRPDFGSRVSDYVFADVDDTMMNLMSYELEHDITAQEPRIEDVSIRMEAKPNTGRLLIDITYRIRGRTIEENMVFPFYIEGRQAQV